MWQVSFRRIPGLEYYDIQGLLGVRYSQGIQILLVHSLHKSAERGVGGG